ncbi:hypothetical protein GCM10022237_09710 [Nocardioides ginsengisoli]|uniref:Nucleotidyl transferase AbiEii/AbiGii toxin family protein n=1 Tax=Nocardioides ginsengisoli TaxID=363868 RepID=A0ABW3W0L0_9ACTN
MAEPATIGRYEPLLMRRLVAVHDALDRAGFAHALGGALALAVHVKEPRFTKDIDLNILADASHPEPLLACLPDEIAVPASAAPAIRRDQQVRLTWPDPATPVDLFFPADPDFHRMVTDRATPFRFGSADIPVMTATDLMVFKMLFDRTKDWADIESLLEADAGDPAEAAQWIERFLGPDAPQIGRLARTREELGT